jgi:hypothetical protein
MRWQPPDAAPLDGLDPTGHLMIRATVGPPTFTAAEVKDVRNISAPYPPLPYPFARRPLSTAPRFH